MLYLLQVVEVVVELLIIMLLQVVEQVV